MVNIIVSKDGSGGQFRRHYNSALGKTYHTKADYLRDMKRGGFEPYNPNSVRKVEDKPYVPSQWARDMGNQIKAQRGKTPSDRFVKELEKRGYTKEKHDKSLAKYEQMRKEGGNV